MCERGLRAFAKLGGAPARDVHTVLEWASRRADSGRLAAGAGRRGSAGLRLRIKRHGSQVGASGREERSSHGSARRIAQSSRPRACESSMGKAHASTPTGLGTRRQGPACPLVTAVTARPPPPLKHDTQLQPSRLDPDVVQRPLPLPRMPPAVILVTMLRPS